MTSTQKTAPEDASTTTVFSTTYVFANANSRRFSTPVRHSAHKCERTVMLVPLSGIPRDLPTDANVRSTTNRSIARRQMKESLDGSADGDFTPGYFDQRNLGITLIASSVEVEKGDEGDACRVVFSPGQGIVNGGHTYEVLQEILDSVDAGELVMPEELVWVHVITGLDPDKRTEIARGLNTSLQVKAQSLAESESAFEWLKSQIAGLPFSSRVGYEENHEKEFDVQFLLALLYSMNPTRAGAVSPPVKAYLSKRSVLDAYVDPTTRKKFTVLEGVVGDILDLYSYIEVTAAELWEPTSATPTLASAKKLGVAYKERLVPLPPKKAPEVILMHWAALISLSAFRQLLEVDSSTGLLSWTKPFSQVKKIWLEAAPTILEDLDKALSTNDRVINPVARAESVWVTVYRDVQAAVARQESAELAKRLAAVNA